MLAWLVAVSLLSVVYGRAVLNVSPREHGRAQRVLFHDGSLHHIENSTIEWCHNITQTYKLSQTKTISSLPVKVSREWTERRCHYIEARNRLAMRPLSSCPDNNYNATSDKKLPLIAVMLGSTTRKIKHRVVKNIPLFIYLLPSLIRTLDCGYRYEVFLGYDLGDAFYDTFEGKTKTLRWWHANVENPMSANNIEIKLRLVSVYNKIRKPGPVFTEIARTAYHSGAEYYFRLNDDTELTVNWAHSFVNALNTLNPKGVGVVGPSCLVNPGILAHDFVSKQHMEIFDAIYYPPEFTDWYMDDWISHVYGMSRTFQSVGIPVVHNFGEQAYEMDKKKLQYLAPAIASGRQKIKDWMKNNKVNSKVITAFEKDDFGKFKIRDIEEIKYSRPNDESVVLKPYEEEAKRKDLEYIKQIAALPKSKETRIISFGVWGSPRYMKGAIRNAELAPIYFPGWVCRFYVFSNVDAETVDKLKSLGAEIVPIPKKLDDFSGTFWRYTVADDPSVDRFIIRDADFRLNARDRFAVEEWIQSGKPLHFIRDNRLMCPKVNGGIWGGVRGAITDMTDKIKNWKGNRSQAGFQKFLDAVIWPKDNTTQIAHDAYCCYMHPGTKPFPTERDMHLHFVGQAFDEREQFDAKFVDYSLRGTHPPWYCRKQVNWIYS